MQKCRSHFEEVLGIYISICARARARSWGAVNRTLAVDFTQQGGEKAGPVTSSRCHKAE